MKKSEITGAVGAVPPADAPIESAQPIQPETLAVQQANARANERELKPFAPPQIRKPVAVIGSPAVSGATVAAQVASISPQPIGVVAELAGEAKLLAGDAVDLIADFFGSDAPKAVADVTAPRVQANEPDLSVVPGQGQPIPDIDPEQHVMDQMEDILPALSAEDRLRMPAASSTDTPTKGLLPDLTPPNGDKFEGVQRGGFSDLADAQYFPLQGDELCQLVLALMDDMADRIKNDLRFSMALVYPRVRAVVEIRVEGHAEDNNAGFEIRKILAPKDGEKGGTPEEIASQRADQIVFVVRTLRQEFTPEGESEHPPDAMRDELGLAKPRKQIIETNTGQRFVDVVSPGSDLAALTR